MKNYFSRGREICESPIHPPLTYPEHVRVRFSCPVNPAIPSCPSAAYVWFHTLSILTPRKQPGLSSCGVTSLLRGGGLFPSSDTGESDGSVGMEIQQNLISKRGVGVRFFSGPSFLLPTSKLFELFVFSSKPTQNHQVRPTIGELKWTGFPLLRPRFGHQSAHTIAKTVRILSKCGPQMSQT